VPTIDLLFQHRVDPNTSVASIQIRGARLPDQVLVFSGVEAPPKI
jgi:hypothetical protein